MTLYLPGTGQCNRYRSTISRTYWSNNRYRSTISRTYWSQWSVSTTMWHTYCKNIRTLYRFIRNLLVTEISVDRRIYTPILRTKACCTNFSGLTGPSNRYRSTNRVPIEGVNWYLYPILYIQYSWATARPGPAHQIYKSWAAAQPGPSIFLMMGRGPARPIKISDDEHRPGPAHYILKILAPGPTGPIKLSQLSARPGPSL